MLHAAPYWSLWYYITNDNKNIINSLSCLSYLLYGAASLLCTHNFSRVTFATELSTNLVYKSIFVIDYNYISIHLLISLQ